MWLCVSIEREAAAWGPGDTERCRTGQDESPIQGKGLKSNTRCLVVAAIVFGVARIQWVGSLSQIRTRTINHGDRIKTTFFLTWTTSIVKIHIVQNGQDSTRWCASAFVMTASLETYCHWYRTVPVFLIVEEAHKPNYQFMPYNFYCLHVQHAWQLNYNCLLFSFLQGNTRVN